MDEPVKSCIDLHIHTYYSDGAFAPAKAVQYALGKKLSAISITDHDSVEGMPEALEEGKRLGLEVIPGVELSAEVNGAERSEMHILGYYINWKNETLRESLALFRKVRQERADRILEKLSKLGVRLGEEALRKKSGRGSIGRLHFAKALIEEGFAKNITDAFQKYLGIGKPAYVPKCRLTPDEAIKMIRRSGGIPVLAHPYYGHYSNRNLLRGLVRSGLRGIEVWHSKHPPQSVELFKNLAKELGLIATGGSDCHGSYADEPAMMGTVKIPYSVVTSLKEQKEAIDRENTSIF